MGLSLSGVFYLGGSLQGIGARLTRHPGLAGSFATGVLAAVVATPCTAPFMATAVGFALTQPAAVALTVILALGLGLALPFLALTLAPHLLGRLPRPGAWMETLKQLLAFPVYATVAWLVWVLTQQVGPAGLLAALIGFVLIGLAAWSFNFAQTAAPWARRVGSGHGRRLACRRRRRDCRPRPCRAAERAADRIRGELRALHAAAPCRAAGRRSPRVRQHDGGLVHHLPRQRACGARQCRRESRLRRPQHRLSQGRLDQPQSRDHPRAGAAWAQRRAALSALCRRRRARRLAANPHPRHSAGRIGPHPRRAAGAGPPCHPRTRSDPACSS